MDTIEVARINTVAIGAVSGREKKKKKDGYTTLGA